MKHKHESLLAAIAGVSTEVAEYITQLETELEDLHIILDTTVSHCFEIENSVLSHNATLNFLPELKTDDKQEVKSPEAYLKEQNVFFDNVHDAIFIVNAQGIVTFWNRSAEYLFGWQEKEIVGQQMQGLLKTAGAADRYREIFELVKKQGEWEGMLTCQSKNNKEIIVESRWILLKEENEHSSILVSSIDQTEKQQTQLQLFRAQRATSIGALASCIAHDLGNTLTSFTIAIKLLQDKVRGVDGKRILAALASSTQHGAEFLKLILNFAKGVEGKHAPLDLRIIFMEVKEFLKSLFPKNIKVVAQLPNFIDLIYGHNSQLYQALINLCLNARDAMPNGGTIKISAQNVTLTEEDCLLFKRVKPGQHVLLSVEDTGCGMEAETLEKIFEPFFTTKDPGKGTGLGLTTVITIIKRHNGYVAVTSTLSKGTCFKIYLPAYLSE